MAIEHYATRDSMGEAGSQWGGPGHYFWDETQTQAYGPYATQQEAEQAEADYAAALDKRHSQ